MPRLRRLFSCAAYRLAPMCYVSVIDGPRIGDHIEVKRMGLLAGPSNTHEEVLNNVDVVRRIAEQLNARAHFYAFGTVKQGADQRQLFSRSPQSPAAQRLGSDVMPA